MNLQTFTYYTDAQYKAHAEALEDERLPVRPAAAVVAAAAAGSQESFYLPGKCQAN